MDIKPQQKYHPEPGELKMQKNVVALAVLFSSAAIIGLSTPATAQVGQNQSRNESKYDRTIGFSR
jgi:hypothetical protein